MLRRLFKEGLFLTYTSAVLGVKGRGERRGRGEIGDWKSCVGGLIVEGSSCIAMVMAGTWLPDTSV